MVSPRRRGRGDDWRVEDVASVGIVVLALEREAVVRRCRGAGDVVEEVGHAAPAPSGEDDRQLEGVVRPCRPLGDPELGHRVVGFQVQVAVPEAVGHRGHRDDVGLLHGEDDQVPAGRELQSPGAHVRTLVGEMRQVDDPHSRRGRCPRSGRRLEGDGHPDVLVPAAVEVRGGHRWGDRPGRGLQLVLRGVREGRRAGRSGDVRVEQGRAGARGEAAGLGAGTRRTRRVGEVRPDQVAAVRVVVGRREGAGRERRLPPGAAGRCHSPGRWWLRRGTRRWCTGRWCCRWER